MRSTANARRRPLCVERSCANRKVLSFSVCHPFPFTTASTSSTFQHYKRLACTLNTSSPRNHKQPTQAQDKGRSPFHLSDSPPFFRSPESVLCSPLVALVLGTSWVSGTFHSIFAAISKRALSRERIAAQQSRLCALKSESMYISSALDATNARLRDVEDKLHSEWTQIQRMEPSIRQRNERLEQLQHAIAKQKHTSEQIQSLQSELNECRHLCATEEKTVVQLTEDCSRKRKRLVRMRADVKNARQRLRRVEKKVETALKKQNLFSPTTL